MALCLTPASSGGTPADPWQRVSFPEAAAGQLRPLNLEFSLPPEFIIRFKMRRTPDAIVLDGRPDQTRVQALLDGIGMPRKVRGTNIVEARTPQGTQNPCQPPGRPREGVIFGARQGPSRPGTAGVAHVTSRTQGREERRQEAKDAPSATGRPREGVNFGAWQGPSRPGTAGVAHATSRTHGRGERRQGAKGAPSRGRLPAPGEVVMHRIRRLPSGPHGQDHGGRSGDDVAPGPDPFLAGLAGFRIRHDVAPAIQL